MFEITLLTVGKCKEKFYLAAAEEYAKRLKGYCAFRLAELPEYRLPEAPSAAEIAMGLEKEADAILEKFPRARGSASLRPRGGSLQARPSRRSCAR